MKKEAQKVGSIILPITTRRTGMTSPNVNFNRGARSGAQPQSSVIPSTANIRKLVGAANRFGNPGIKNGQLTSFEIWHYLPFTQLAATYRFFENANTTNFPFTNIRTNQLQVGESMIIDRLHFTIASIDTTAPANPIVSVVESFDGSGFTGAYLSEMNWFNDNNRVIKNLSLTQMKPDFNKHGWSDVNNSLHLDSKISIQPLVSFVNVLQMSAVTGGEPTANLWIGCHASGVGTLLAPKTTY